MFYKINHNGNRIKYPIAWQNLNQNFTTDFRNLLSLKNWLKLKKWYFLILFKIKQNFNVLILKKKIKHEKV